MYKLQVFPELAGLATPEKFSPLKKLFENSVSSIATEEASLYRREVAKAAVQFMCNTTVRANRHIMLSRVFGHSPSLSWEQFSQEIHLAHEALNTTFDEYGLQNGIIQLADGARILYPLVGFEYRLDKEGFNWNFYIPPSTPDASEPEALPFHAFSEFCGVPIPQIDLSDFTK
jgi:hypothetical protein